MDSAELFRFEGLTSAIRPLTFDLSSSGGDAAGCPYHS